MTTSERSSPDTWINLQRYTESFIMRPFPVVLRLLPIMFIGLLGACNNEPQPARSTSNLKMIDDTLITYNKGVVRTEEQEITDFTARYGWDMKETASGLRYLVYKPGEGPRAEKGKIAVIRYKVSLLNGRKIYSSDSLGPKEFVVGHGGVEAGLEEGMRFLAAN